LISIGDEIISINGLLVKGKTRVEVAKLIQASEVKHKSNIQKQIFELAFLGSSDNSL